MKKSTAPRKSNSRSQRRALARARREAVLNGPMPVVHPHAAGIDIAVSDDLWVAVGEVAGEPPVRAFSPRPAGHQELCAWLQKCGVETVAMEATGSYWLSLYLALREAGCAVVVVNPRLVKTLQRKSDVSDGQWLRYLHSVGLLRGSFIPAEEFLRLRTLSRHRENLLRSGGEHIQRLQKALDEMNLHVHHVITDLTGVTGRTILEAIIAGERDAAKLAALRDRRIQAPEATIIESLQGRWDEEHLLVLRQEYASWQHFQQQISMCDELLLAGAEALLRKLPAEAEAKEEAQPVATGGCQHKAARRKRSKNEPAEGARWQEVLRRLLGVDLTLTPGLSLLTVLALVCELGPDWSSFPTAGHFASWLGLGPEHRISGGKILSRATRTVQHRVRTLLKMGAQSLAPHQRALGVLYGRWRAPLGPAKANTAMAHKLARLIWHQVTYQTAYDDSYLARLDEIQTTRAQKKLVRAAAQFGLKLVPLKEAA
jgi:transposase